MLAKRIIPCLDVRNGRVVKGVKFKNHIDMGDPVELARYYSDQGADELVFYDITASPEGREIDLSWIEKVAKQISIPFSVAGGIRTIEIAKRVFDAGADKVSVNTPALTRPDLINELAEKFGSQAVVIGIDVKNGELYSNTGDPNKMSKTNWTALEWIKEVQLRGAGELVINSIANDGVKGGYAIDLLKEIGNIVTIPVIASGGAGCKEHFKVVFEDANVDGALAASVFHSKTIIINELKQYLSQSNIPIRLTS